MNKLLIISIYDSGYGFSIWYDNKVYGKESNNKFFKKIKKEYDNDIYDSEHEISSFQEYLESLNFDEIYVCENGWIERIK